MTEDLLPLIEETYEDAVAPEGLLANDGIRELRLTEAEDLTVDAVNVLAEAMVSTTCLGRLELVCYEEIPDEHTFVVLGEGLKRNASLEKFELVAEGFGNDDSLPEILRTLQNHPNLLSLTLEKINISEQVMEVLRGWRNCKDCRLQELKIGETSHLPAFGASRGKAVENRSLKRLELNSVDLSSNDLEGLRNSFPNLRVLELPHNRICYLSPLESILCNEDSEVQELDLRRNQSYQLRFNHEDFYEDKS
ncbi:unnamed protein product [Cylindrotheca closterium]|uniref:Uncharacterized protein n=1 Tax=Cylindrotheca closterium TaxID=2856 RepID=A0AAD2CSN3_9STRA|nr:unnamed protein product [Cylindrotheca closterium]